MRTTALRVSLVLAAFALALPRSTRAAEPKPTKAMTVTALDAETNQPLTGATVTLRAKGYYRDEKPVDAAGRHTVNVEADSEYASVLCRKHGYVTTAASWDTLRESVPAELPAEYTFRLAKARTIGGRVVDEAGKPVAGAKVVLNHWREGSRRLGDPQPPQPVVGPRIPREQRTTDADGRWSYAGAAPDTNEVDVHIGHADFVRDRKDRRPAIQDLFDGTDVTVLERGFDVTGTVVSADGKPVEGARVTTVEKYYVVNDYGITKKTDAAGRFTLPHLRAGDVTVTVTAKGFGPEMQALKVAPGMAPLTVTLAPGHVLRGRVVDPEGKPVEGVFVSSRSWRDKSSLNLRGTTDADGRFEFPDAPADAVEFQLGKTGFHVVHAKVSAVAEDDDAPVIQLKRDSTSPGL